MCVACCRSEFNVGGSLTIASVLPKIADGGPFDFVFKELLLLLLSSSKLVIGGATTICRALQLSSQHVKELQQSKTKRDNQRISSCVNVTARHILTSNRFICWDIKPCVRDLLDCIPSWYLPSRWKLPTYRTLLFRSSRWMCLSFGDYLLCP